MNLGCLIGRHDWKCVAAWLEDMSGKRVPKGVKLTGAHRTETKVYKCRKCGKTKREYE